MADIVIREDIEYQCLLALCDKRIEKGVEEVVAAVSMGQLSTYWDIGQYIVEFEQGGAVKAEYGQVLLATLARDLTARRGKGYSKSNLYLMRKFYLTFQDGCEKLAGLTWSHITELINISDDLERQFYINECIAEKWSVRTLQRQKDSALFLKLAAAKENRNEVLELAERGIQISTAKDIVHDTYTLDFLGLDLKKKYSEKTLQKKLIAHLRDFLLELGKGYTFEKEQYPITINGKTYHCDLVFYNRIMKCFVLVDLKIRPVKHYRHWSDEYVYGLFCGGS